MFKIFNKIDEIKKQNELLKKNMIGLSDLVMKTNQIVEYQVNTITDLKQRNKSLTEELEFYKKQSRINLSRAGGFATAAKKARDEKKILEESLKAADVFTAELIDNVNTKDIRIKKIETDYLQSTNHNTKLTNEINKLKEEKKTANKIIKDLNNDLIREKVKPKKAPTINELEKDKLFHGKRKN